MTTGPAHSDAGAKQWLTVPWIYGAFSWLLGGPAAARRFVRDDVAPAPGARILDLGCGPGRLVEYLPAHIGAYHGIDNNPAYIDAARRRWQGRPNVSFACGDAAAAAPDAGSYDLVIALAVLHHLNDDDAARLCQLAHHALKPGGRFIAYDQVWLEQQHPIARWLIACDRGQAVRTLDGYAAVARTQFHEIHQTLRHDTLRVPYTIVVMTCTRTV